MWGTFYHSLLIFEACISFTSDEGNKNSIPLLFLCCPKKKKQKEKPALRGFASNFKYQIANFKSKTNVLTENNAPLTCRSIGSGFRATKSLLLICLYPILRQAQDRPDRAIQKEWYIMTNILDHPVKPDDDIHGRSVSVNRKRNIYDCSWRGRKGKF